MPAENTSKYKPVALGDLRESALSPVRKIGVQFRSFVIENLSIDSNRNLLEPRKKNGNRWVTVTDSKKHRARVCISNHVWQQAIKQGYQITNEVSIDVAIDGLRLDTWCQLEIVAMAVRVSGQSQTEARREYINKYCIKKGYFRRKKRPLPVIVHKVAIVTSKQSTIESDITNQIGIKKKYISSHRFNGKADQLSSLIHKLANQNRHDLICLYRGGREDEYMFVYSDPAVLDEIVKSPIPIVSALGHEQDIPPVQQVVDMGFASPSKFALYIKDLNSSALAETQYLTEDIYKYFEKYLLTLKNSILKDFSEINHIASALKSALENKREQKKRDRDILIRNIIIVALSSLLLSSLLLLALYLFYFRIKNQL